MWLSKQQTAPRRPGEGQVGTVTMAGEELAVRLDSEVRAPVVYAPAGFHWTPGAGDQVLVIKGQGERPCIVGVKEGGSPRQVTVRAGVVALEGAVEINGMALEDYIRAVTAQAAEAQ